MQNCFFVLICTVCTVCTVPPKVSFHWKARCFVVKQQRRRPNVFRVFKFFFKQKCVFIYLYLKTGHFLKFLLQKHKRFRPICLYCFYKTGQALKWLCFRLQVTYALYFLMIFIKKNSRMLYVEGGIFILMFGPPYKNGPNRSHKNIGHFWRCYYKGLYTDIYYVRVSKYLYFYIFILLSIFVFVNFNIWEN